MSDSIELLDAGDGRRLERFGVRIVDRAAPGATDRPLDPEAWAAADLRFERSTGWQAGDPGALESWPVTVGELTFELRATATGQVGLFPEHLLSLPWLRARALARRAGGGRAEPGTAFVLNLFASTGAATLAMAGTGAGVAHVDGSRPAVAWARHNAALSGLAGASIRWLVDDALGFVQREGRRGRRYAGLVLDPPSYGHAGGRPWRLDAALPELLDACAAVTEPGGFVLLTAHTPGIGPDELAAHLATAFGVPSRLVEAGDLELEARSGARLALGAFARIMAG